MSGRIVKVSGPLVVAEGMEDANMADVVRVGKQQLIGEILNMTGGSASIQVYEETSGLGPGAEVTTTGMPLSVELGPGMLEGIYDGGNFTVARLRVSLGNGNAGLFAANGGTIRNVVIASASALRGQWHAGMVCGENTGTIERCTNRASVTDGGSNTLGTHPHDTTILLYTTSGKKQSPLFPCPIIFCFAQNLRRYSTFLFLISKILQSAPLTRRNPRCKSP